jgi:hypothetical protein
MDTNFLNAKCDRMIFKEFNTIVGNLTLSPLISKTHSEEKEHGNNNFQWNKHKQRKLQTPN